MNSTQNNTVESAKKSFLTVQMCVEELSSVDRRFPDVFAKLKHFDFMFQSRKKKAITVRQNAKMSILFKDLIQYE